MGTSVLSRKFNRLHVDERAGAMLRNRMNGNGFRDSSSADGGGAILEMLARENVRFQL
eukprot:CAMPEP_0198253928 /NCGR_PEP_ID=MMETSP1447-20131203/4307_1 /TAXON_ID=420782 /ORGANISM="Chaetoceros dichaeta, Strain CCMP1751" /LENGTH=57 /DNA_ID=CAMNT_0043939799 /DNA_START=247 /DNA_END=420 /DNA_ORIENTATION=-